MRFPPKASMQALLICGVVGVIGTLGFVTSHHLTKTAPPPASAQHQTPPVAVVAMPELEPELLRQQALRPHSDSEMEASAKYPVEAIVEADKGDTLLDLLLKVGVDRNDATKAIAALTGVYNPRALKIGQEVTVIFDRPADGIGAGPFSGLSLQPEAGRQVSAKRGPDGFTAHEIKHEVTRQLAHFSGTIRGSLFESAVAQGVPSPILSEIIRAFSYDVDFQRDLQPGDGFEVMFERWVDKSGQIIRDGNVVFARLTLSGDAMPIYRYVDAAGNADYYNPKGESVRKALLRTPVDGARITSGFGMRLHPILGFSTMHKGIDFAVSTGTPIMAAGAGTIEYAGAKSSYGYYVKIKHDSVHATAYAHLSRFAQGIRSGVHVNQGQVIAFSGATGRATGPHLHYEVLVHDEQVNPMSIKFQSGNKLAGRELNRFLDSIGQAKNWLAQTPLSTKVALNHKD